MIIYCWKFHDNSVADLEEGPSLWVKILMARRGKHVSGWKNFLAPTYGGGLRLQASYCLLMAALFT